jgi:adenine-specific DNA-methyltransferase
MWFPIAGPDGKEVYPIHDDGREACWALGKTAVSELLKSNDIVWKNRGTDEEPKWVPYTREYAKESPSRPFASLWTDLPTTRQTKAHQKELFGIGNEFATPKPEALIERILQLSTNPGDLVLDSFAGSGTTGATAHKMGRRWIMVELGEHCHTHIIPRLKKVIDGDDLGGITEAVDWKGGGGFRYCRLAPSLLEKDRWGNWVINDAYNAEMLSEAVCKLMGFTYAPSEQHYWMHGWSSENDFIYVTTQNLTHDQLKAIAAEVGEERSLLICCKAFRSNPDAFPNLTIRKIPQAVLRKCEWGKDDYSLNVANLPIASPRQDEESDLASTPAKKTQPNPNQPDLFLAEGSK